MTTKPPVQKNDEIQVIFEDLTHDGSGVAKVDGYPLFVPNALPGETGKVKVIKTQKGYGFGRLMEIENESPDRVEPPCPIFKWCGGCSIQHLSYDAQLQAKHKQVNDVMERIGKLKDVPVHPVLGMEEPWRYRNKVQVPVGRREGHLVTGFYQKRSHEIIPMESCIIQNETNDKIVQIVKEICDQFGIPAYDEKNHKGTLRHIMVRYGKASGDIMVVLVTRSHKLQNRDQIVDAIVNKVEGLTSLIQNIQPEKSNVILGAQSNVLWGEEFIHDTIGDVKFAISARSFYQVNPDQTNVLYAKALEFADLQGHETVIDAYCGIGTISLFLAQKAKKVYGVDIVSEAIVDARRNAELNEMTNVEFAVGAAEEVIPNWAKEGITADVLVVDPPRKGCDEALLNTMIKMQPQKIVYVSCNPGTLARDLRILEDGGFKTVEIQPVDMFPQTGHVENVALLVLKL